MGRPTPLWPIVPGSTRARAREAWLSQQGECSLARARCVAAISLKESGRGLGPLIFLPIGSLRYVLNCLFVRSHAGVGAQADACTRRRAPLDWSAQCRVVCMCTYRISGRPAYVARQPSTSLLSREMAETKHIGSGFELASREGVRENGASKATRDVDQL
jgi:hypothetical protein